MFYIRIYVVIFYYFRQIEINLTIIIYEAAGFVNGQKSGKKVVCMNK